MTLAELIPSLRSSLPRRLEPGLWPCSAQHLPGGDVELGSVGLVGIAARYGTPTVVVDVAELRRGWEEVVRAFRDIDVAGAADGLLGAETMRIVEDLGAGLSVRSLSELRAVTTAGFPTDRLILHGDCAQLPAVSFAATVGVGRIVLGSMVEIEAAARASCASNPQRVLLSISTGTIDGVTDMSTRGRLARGFSVGSIEVDEAVRRIITAPGLQLVGVHCWIDSPFTTAEPYLQACREGLWFAQATLDRYGVHLGELRLGGHDAEPLAIGGWAPCQLAGNLRRYVGEVCAALSLPRPRLGVEPGPTPAATPVLTLCRVLAVHREEDRVVAEVDDRSSASAPSMRLAAPRSVHMLNRLSPARDVHVEIVRTGRGDHRAAHVAGQDTLLPEDIAPHDLLAVPSHGHSTPGVAGRRQLAPAVVAVDNGLCRPLESLAPHQERLVSCRRVG